MYSYIMNDNTRFNKDLIKNRQVRIFLSSTFSDMQDERTELVKTLEVLKEEVFPQVSLFSFNRITTKNLTI